MQALIESCENYRLQAENYFNRHFLRPSIYLDLRGQAAGQAVLTQAKLRFNPILYQENQAHFLQHTAGHEVAHWIIFQHCGRVKPHGQQWQELMRHGFNLPPERLHHYNLDSVIGQLYFYTCGCREHQLTIRRHRAILRGQRYYCRHCKQYLMPTEDNKLQWN